MGSVTIMWSDRDVTFQCAGIDQITDVLSVLDERQAGCTRTASISGRHASKRPGWSRPSLRGETRLVLVGGRIAATLTLDWSDPVWSGIPGTAGYLHRMAVRRWAAGLGGAF